MLREYAEVLGGDFRGYAHHTQRVLAFTVAFARPRDEQLERIAIAAAFHDLGIWTDRTFDYLEPSRALARAHLDGIGRPEWVPEIVEMILRHHQVRPYRQRPDWLVEPFRRADWVDVSGGMLTFGLPRAFVRETYARWPSAGFHGRLIRLAVERLRTHPLSPLPMLKI